MAKCRAFSELFSAGTIFGAWLVLALTVPLTATKAEAGNCNADADSGVDWTDCRKRNLILSGSNLAGAKLAEADFSSTDLRRTKLEGADFTKAALARAALDNSSAANANFEKALGYRTSFANADLAGANFVKAEMQRADFANAILTDTDFSKSELARVDFSGADLNGTRFSFANLARADLRSAEFATSIDFEGAYFYQTKLEGVDLSKATGLEQWQVDMACGDDRTTLPDALARPTNWPCKPE